VRFNIQEDNSVDFFWLFEIRFMFEEKLENYALIKVLSFFWTSFVLSEGSLQINSASLAFQSRNFT